MASSESGINFTLTPDDDLDCVIYQGCDIYFSLVFQDSDGVPMDVTGWDASMTLRKRARSDDFVTQFTVGTGRVTIGSTDGLIEFTMTEEDSAALEACDGVYDIRVKNADGFRWQAQSGKFKITREITRQ